MEIRTARLDGLQQFAAKQADVDASTAVAFSRSWFSLCSCDRSDARERSRASSSGLVAIKQTPSLRWPTMAGES